MRLSFRRSLLAVAVFGAVPLLVACPKKETPTIVVDAGPPPEPVDTAPTVLVPLEDDAGDAGEEDADADAGKPKGPGVPTNVTRIKQCCAQLRTQAKALGASPEAGMLTAAAAQCDVAAVQVGSKGTAPELGAVKAILAGRTLPPVCNF